MSPDNQTVIALREALKVSPDNLPLREHIAQTLLSLGRPDEAEQDFRHALIQSPESLSLKVGLARCFAHQGKESHALAILESIISSKSCPPTARLLYARLLLKTGNPRDAHLHYQQAIASDPTLADPDLALQLNTSPPPALVPLLEQDLTPSPIDPDIERPKISFKDVGGMDSVKDEIRMKIIHPLTHPELYAAYGKKVGGGILLYGPPGCGKTHLARATAGEIHASFISVGIHEILDMYLGNSEKNLHELFEQARRNTPCVLFFDEVDALAANRADMRHSAGRNVINQFLSELDGISSNNDGLLVLAATNAPWHVDSAFRRPGRFDRILFVPPPDPTARAAILRILTTGKPLHDIDFDRIAKKTHAFSGADLKALLDLAIEAKLKQAMKAGGALSPLTEKDLLAPLSTVKPSTREWLATARNYATYSNQSGTYDDILTYLKNN